ncbi:MAG: hypothetical protein IPO00_03590 [Betaproteobacteria bacterium]|nr:hypothetical protein [Betaproteobacteria bacterium]
MSLALEFVQPRQASGADGEVVDATAQIHLLGVKETDSFSQTQEGHSFMWQWPRAKVDRGDAAPA